MLQARVESRRAQGELVSSAGDARATRLQLEEQMGPPDSRAVVREHAGAPQAAPLTLHRPALVAGPAARQPSRSGAAAVRGDVVRWGPPS